MTDKEEVYVKSDGYTDHGHDHKGADRGADLHPFIGYNFRISELHAAVGLAQIRKLDMFLAIQKKNQGMLKDILSQVPGITFRKVPDPEGDSCSFLSWFLPTTELTEAVVEEMKTQGILAGSFYWFKNNWHYISKWDHLRNAETLQGVTHDVHLALKEYATKSFPASDAVMGRCVSTAISLVWTEEQIKDKGDKMVNAIKKVMEREGVPA